MRKILATTLVLGVVTLLAYGQSSQSSSGSSGVEQQITSWMEQSRNAALKGDTSWLQQHAADNYVSVNAMGERLSKSEAISQMKSGTLKLESIDVIDRDARVYGDTAVYQGHARLKGTYNGHDMSGEYRATWVWAKQGGTWKLVSHQNTRVGQAASQAAK